MDAPTITAAALDTLEETGLEKLTMRGVAGRLGVRVGGLYYHHPDKAALLRSMADTLCRRVLDEPGADVSAVHLCVAVRAVLRAHRDGARLLAAAPLSGSAGALDLMERLIELVEPEVGPGRANVAADTLMAYVTGFVLQEQVGSGTGPPPGMSLDDMADRFPRIMRGLGGDDDAAFATAVRAVVDGFAARTLSPGVPSGAPG